MCDSDRIQAGGLVMKADNNSAGIDRNSQELTGRITPGIRKADLQEQPDGARNIKLVVEYDGTRYYGFQRQKTSLLFRLP